MKKTSARLMKAQVRDGLIYWIYIPVAVIAGGRAMDWGLNLPRIPSHVLLSILAVLLTASGVTLVQLAIKDLSVYGGGTPNPMAPSNRLVSERSYRLCRHPMFLGYDIAALGVILFLRSTGALSVSYPLFMLLQVRFLKKEERRLEARFGERFREYRERVPFLVPLALHERENR